MRLELQSERVKSPRVRTNVKGALCQLFQNSIAAAAQQSVDQLNTQTATVNSQFRAQEMAQHASEEPLGSLRRQQDQMMEAQRKESVENNREHDQMMSLLTALTERMSAQPPAE